MLRCEIWLGLEEITDAFLDMDCYQVCDCEILNFLSTANFVFKLSSFFPCGPYQISQSRLRQNNSISYLSTSLSTSHILRPGSR